MIYTHRINVNINPNSVLLETEIKKIIQGDVNTNKFIITIKDGNDDFQIPTDATARLMARKTDGNQVFEDCEIIDNKVEILMPEQLFTTVGNVNCTVGLYGEANKELLITLPFKIEVIENPFKPVGACSSNEYGTLTQALFLVDDKVQDMENEVNSAITVTSEAVSRAVGATDTAAYNANLAADKANEAAKLENIEQKAAAAVEATSYANQAAQRADTAAAACEGIVDNVKSATQEILDEKNITADGYNRHENNEVVISNEKSVAQNLKIMSILGVTRVKKESTGLISPSNKAALYSVGKDGNIEINISNNNLFKYNLNSYSEYDSDKVTINSSSTNSIALTSVANKPSGGVYYNNIIIPPQTTVSIKCAASGTNLSYAKIIVYKGSTKGGNVYGVFSVNTVNTITTGADSQCISIGLIPSYDSIEVIQVAFSNVQIEFGTSVSQAFTSCENLQYILELKDLNNNILAPLRWVQDGTCDKIIRKNGVWGVERNCGYIEFNGTESWGGDGSSSVYYNPNNTITNITRQPGHCTHYQNEFDDPSIASQSVPRVRIGHYYSGQTYSNIYIYNTGQLDLTGFKSWLASQNSAGTPVTVIYPIVDNKRSFIVLNAKAQYILNSMLSSSGKVNIYTTDGARLNIWVPKGFYPVDINLDSTYPIGSIFIYTSDVNPSGILGGTWESISIGFSQGIYAFKRTA